MGIRAMRDRPDSDPLEDAVTFQILCFAEGRDSGDKRFDDALTPRAFAKALIELVRDHPVKVEVGFPYIRI